MSLTKLQTILIDVHERVIVHREVFDPDQETFNFLLQAGLTPESETNQRYLQLVRTLRHEDYNVRSSAAKFLCMILFRNYNLQNRIRSLMPITILTTNLLVFNLPVIYSSSVLTDLKRDMKSEKNPNKNTVFWHFPAHHIPTEPLPITEMLDSAVEEMLRLKIDPLYQFVGSLTGGKSAIKQQIKMKPGLLERKLSAHFSSPTHSVGNYSSQGIGSKSFRLKSTQGNNEKSEDLSPNSQSFVTLAPKFSRSHSTSYVSTSSVDKISRKEGRSITITTDRSQDNSPVASITKTPKFSEGARDFWMPREYPGPNVPNNRRRLQKGASKKSFSTKNISQVDTGVTTPAQVSLEKSSELKPLKTKVTLLDILEKNPDRAREIKLKLSRSRMDLQECLDYSPVSSPNRSMSISKERTRSYTNPKSDRGRNTRDLSADYLGAELSDMSRETLRLLKQDRHDMYKDYDKQVERLRLRPFSKEKFESMSFDPNEFPRKIEIPVVDRKKAFVDFLNAGGKVAGKPPAKEEGIKGNTFHARKWKNHVSKARLSNFGKGEEKYVLHLSPISSVVQADMKKRSPKKEKHEIEKIKNHLEEDVAASQQKYITNIMEVGELDRKVYGESFKKYLDVLNYEKANYDVNDTSKLGDAFDLVNIIYEAKEKHRNRTPMKSKESFMEDDEEENENKRMDNKKDKSDLRYSKQVPRSRLFLRRRGSSVASSVGEVDHVTGHIDHHSNGKGKKMVVAEEMMRTSTNNSKSLKSEIASMNATAKEGRFFSKS